jgi:hypothetical protein
VSAEPIERKEILIVGSRFEPTDVGRARAHQAGARRKFRANITISVSGGLRAREASAGLLYAAHDAPSLDYMAWLFTSEKQTLAAFP